jgi:hypothetical protein
MTHIEIDSFPIESYSAFPDFADASTALSVLQSVNSVFDYRAVHNFDDPFLSALQKEGSQPMQANTVSYSEAHKLVTALAKVYETVGFWSTSDW